MPSVSEPVPEPQDTTMADAPEEATPATEGSSEAAEEQRVSILPGATEFAASFCFEKEDHTLGNALRWIIMKNPVVEFCGYSIPHPAEEKMNLRIQTYPEDHANVYEVLEKGLDDLMDLCDVVMDKFTISRDEFEKAKAATARA